MRGLNWSDEEIAILQREYPIRKNAEIAKILNRPEYSVRTKASELGLRKPPAFFGLARLKRSEEELQIKIRVRPLGKDEQIPSMPCLLCHLMSMSGSMEGKKVSLEYSEPLRAAA